MIFVIGGIVGLCFYVINTRIIQFEFRNDGLFLNFWNFHKRTTLTLICLLHAIAWQVIYYCYSISVVTILISIIVSILIWMAWIDYHTMMLPDTLQIELFMFAILLLRKNNEFFFSFDSTTITEKILTMLLFTLCTLLITKKQSLNQWNFIGIGDCKLFISLSLIIPWLYLWILLFFAALGNLGWLIINKIFFNRSQEGYFPFVPAILFGFIMILLFGDDFVRLLSK